MILKITANRERCTVPWYFEAAFFKGGTRPAIWVNHSVISHKAQEDARAKVVQNNYFTRIMLVSGSVILDKLTNVPWKSMVGSDVNFPVENSSFLGDIRSFRGWKKFMFPEINRKFGSKNLTVHRPTRVATRVEWLESNAVGWLRSGPTWPVRKIKPWGRLHGPLHRFPQKKGDVKHCLIHTEKFTGKKVVSWSVEQKPSLGGQLGRLEVMIWRGF